MKEFWANLLRLIFQDAKSLFSSGSLTLAFLFIYLFGDKTNIFNILFWITLSIFIFALIYYVYGQISKIIKRKKDERIKAQKEYRDSYEYIYDIYLNLNKEERDIFYQLFHNKEVIIPYADFSEEEYAHTNEFINMTYFKDREDQRYGKKSDYNVYCEHNECYTNKSDSPLNRGYAWKSYKFTMQPSFRNDYGGVIEKAKKIIDDNLI